VLYSLEPDEAVYVFVSLELSCVVSGYHFLGWLSMCVEWWVFLQLTPILRRMQHFTGSIYKIVVIDLTEFLS